MCYLRRDSWAGEVAFDKEKAASLALQAKLDSINGEHGDAYIEEPYSKISRDFSPIHVNPYFSDFASLPATITHGLWSSAAPRCYLENISGSS